MGDDHRDWELDPLAAVDRARVRRPQAIGLLGRQPEHPAVVCAEDQRRVVAVVTRDFVQEAQQSPVHQPELVEVSPGHHQLVADPQPPGAHRLAVRVQFLAQGFVQRVDPELALVNRREHLDVPHRVDAVVVGEPLGDERDDLLTRRARIASLHQEQVATHPLGALEARSLAAPDRVRALHDHAARGLAEDVAETGGGHRAGLHQLREGLAGSDRRELVGVAHQHHVRVPPDRTQERHQQLQIRHRGLIHDQQVARKRILLVVGRALAGHPSERRVHGPGADPAGLAHPGRRPARRRHQRHAGAARGRACGDRADRGRLAGPGPPGDQRESVRERVPRPGELLAGQRRALGATEVAPGPSLPEPAARRLGQHLRHALGQLGLERRGRGPVDPPPGADQIPRSDQIVDRRLAYVRAEEAPELCEERVEGHAGAAAALGLGEHVEGARAGPLGVLRGAAERAGDPIGDQEPHPEHAGQLVRAPGDDLVGGIAVRVMDPRDQVGQPVRREQQMQATRQPQALPGGAGLVGRAAAQAGRAQGRAGVAVDRLDDFGDAVAVDQPRGPLDPQVLDAHQVDRDRLGVGRG